MEPRTHLSIDPTLCGRVVAMETDRATVALETSSVMIADSSGLIHGGFIFGLADYAAMLAVNHPNVVLGMAETRFLKPVALGTTVTAEAWVLQREGKKIRVEVQGRVEDETVFSGIFTCVIPPTHVLGG